MILPFLFLVNKFSEIKKLGPPNYFADLRLEPQKYLADFSLWSRQIPLRPGYLLNFEQTELFWFIFFYYGRNKNVGSYYTLI